MNCILCLVLRGCILSGLYCVLVETTFASFHSRTPHYLAVAPSLHSVQVYFDSFENMLTSQSVSPVPE